MTPKKKLSENISHCGLKFKLPQKETTVIIAIYVRKPLRKIFNNGINSDI